MLFTYVGGFSVVKNSVLVFLVIIIIILSLMKQLTKRNHKM